jgi:hypothetical protein
MAPVGAALDRAALDQYWDSTLKQGVSILIQETYLHI